MLKFYFYNNSLEPNFKQARISISKNYFSNIPQNISINSDTFVLKDEFHITIIGRTIGNKIYYEIKDDYNVEDILLDIHQFIQERINEISITLDDFYLLEKHYKDELSPRKSIIAKISTTLITDLHQFLNSKYALNLDQGCQPHITLYSLDNILAVGLNYKDDFEKYKVKKIELE